MRFIDLFQKDIPAQEQDAFRVAALQSNINRSRLFAPVMLCMQGILFLIDLGAWLTNKRHNMPILPYAVLYFVQMVGSLALYAYARKSRDAQGAYPKRAEWIIYGYVVFTMCMSSVVSLFDQWINAQVIVYMVNMIALSSIFYVGNRKILFACALSLAIMFVGLPFFQSNQDMLLGHYFNLTVFTVTALLVSRVLYTSFVKDFRSGELLKRTNERLQNEILHNQIANSELLQLNQHLQQITMVDELTGIPNRRSLQNYFDITYEFYQKGEALLSVIVIDIDHFKAYNDLYGHLEGDRALKQVASAISVQHRNSDFVARFGGEEFIFASFNTTQETVLRIAERVRTSVANLRIPHKHAGEGMLTISLGVCTRVINDKQDIQHVIRQADEAMYRAKENGRNRVECC